MKSLTDAFQVDNTDRKVAADMQKLIHSGKCLTYSVISLSLKPHHVSEAVSSFITRNTSTMKYNELGPINRARQQSRAPKRGIFLKKNHTTDRINDVSPQHLFGGGGSYTGDLGECVNEAYADGHLSP
jgi:hypothetical protein